MEPITRSEIYMAAAAGEYDGELPEPVTRSDEYWVKIIGGIENEKLTPEEIDAAIEAYLNSHDADIVTEQELSDALAGYYDKNWLFTNTGTYQNDIGTAYHYYGDVVFVLSLQRSQYISWKNGGYKPPVHLNSNASIVRN